MQQRRASRRAHFTHAELMSPEDLRETPEKSRETAISFLPLAFYLAMFCRAYEEIHVVRHYE